MIQPFERIYSDLKGFGENRIKLVGVTKRQPLEKLRTAVKAGVQILGNNYVQEGTRIQQGLSDLKVEWHFIGHIQSRKANQLASYDMVQSLDRLSVADALDQHLRNLGKNLRVLVEINVGEEEQKSGVLPGKLPAFLEELKRFSQIKVSGLMCLPPPLYPIEERRKYFSQMRHWFEEYRFFGWDCLSMGTSDDYLIALEEGATMIRLGRALFGPC